MERTMEGIATWARESVARLSGELTGALGSRLAAVVASGDATDEGAAGVISLLVVVDRVDGAVLEGVGAALGRAKVGRVEPPLVMTGQEIRRSLDAWPVELASIAATGRVVAGELDLSTLNVQREALRLQCERELRGLVIHCRFAYLANRKDEARLGEMVAGGAARLVVLARATLRAAGQVPEGRADEILGRLGKLVGGSSELLAAAWAMRQEKRPKWSGERLLELSALLERWVEAVDRLDVAGGE